MVDSARVLDRIARLDSFLKLLEGIRADGPSRYLSDLDTRLRAERALQLAIQIVIDVGAHLVSELGLTPPPDYRGVFTSLVQGGVIEEPLGSRLAEAAGMRNLLVHGYADLDDRQVWRSLERLDDLRGFAAAALAAADD